jgi:hypothetical protein
MNGSRNIGDNRKNRYRPLIVLILLALPTTLLVHTGSGQQPLVRLPAVSQEPPDVWRRRESPQAAGKVPCGPLIAPSAYASATPPVVPAAQILPAVELPEAASQSDLSELVPEPPLGPDVLPGRPNQDVAARVVRLPPVLEALGRAMVPGAAPNGSEPGGAPRGHKIPLSTAAESGEFDATNRDGLISLVARDTPLSEILSSIAQGQRLNVVCAEDISARISITLHEVTLEHALTAILSTAGYTWTQANGIIQVTSVSDSTRLSPETQGRRTEVFPLDYVAAADVDEVVKGLLSPVGQSFPIAASATDLRRTKEAVVIEDLPGYLNRIREYIFQADQPPRQVLIEANVLEVVLDSNKRCGVNFEHLFSVAGNPITISTTGFANPGAPQAFFATLAGGHLEGVIEALKTTTDAKTLASPRVLAVNGQEARIQIGEQLGFRVITTTETSTMESVEFLDTGVVLTVTPHISRDNRVLMQVKPQVSSGAVNPDTGLPEEETTEVQTNILLSDGQGILIGGLIQEVDSLTQNKIPILGDLWLVGGLFQRHQVIKERSEIVISLVARVLPYEPCYQEYEDFQVQRSRTPLTYGPLYSYPRPWEPKMPDPYHNPRTFP